LPGIGEAIGDKVGKSTYQIYSFKFYSKYS